VADVLDRDGTDASDSSPLPEVSPHLDESNTDDVIPPTPEAELKKGRKRVRKVKDKTFMEEDGYVCKYGSVPMKVCLAGHFFDFVCDGAVNLWRYDNNYCL
jgi:hypothetical protein